MILLKTIGNGEVDTHETLVFNKIICILNNHENVYKYLKYKEKYESLCKST